MRRAWLWAFTRLAGLCFSDLVIYAPDGENVQAMHLATSEQSLFDSVTSLSDQLRWDAGERLHTGDDEPDPGTPDVVTDPPYHPNCIACMNIEQLRRLQPMQADGLVRDYLAELRVEALPTREPGHFCRPHGGTLA